MLLWLLWLLLLALQMLLRLLLPVTLTDASRDQLQNWLSNRRGRVVELDVLSGLIP